MKSAHPVFNLFLRLTTTSGKPVAFVSMLTPDRSALFRWLPEGLLRQVAYQSIKAVDMALAVLRAKRPGAIVIFEHKPQYSALLYLACLLKRVPVFFFVHDIQQTSSRSRAHRLGFRLLQRLVAGGAFWPIHLEIGDDVLPEPLRFRKSVVLPHPTPALPLATREPFDAARVKLGIVGMLRPDKPIAGVVAALERLVRSEPRYELRIGTPFWQISKELADGGTEVVDTSTPEQYQRFLLGTDIIVTSFDRSSFYFRPSGIINDALAAGCFVVAPNFPVFAAQVSAPARVGVTYETLDELPAAVGRAAAALEQGVDHASWRTSRGDAALLARLGEAIERAGARAD